MPSLSATGTTPADDVTITSAVTPTLSHPETDAEVFLEAENLKFFASVPPTLACLFLLTAIGLIGNSVVFAVYYRRFKPSPTRTYILAISVCDLASNVYCPLKETILFRFQYTFYSSWACKLMRPLTGFLVVLSSYMLVAVAVDRQIRICQNQALAQSCARKAGKIVVVCALLAFLTNIPMVFIMDVRTVAFSTSNVTGVKCSSLDPDEDALNLFNGVLHVLVTVAASATMLVCYGKIAYHLRKHNASKAGTRSREPHAEDSKAAGPPSTTGNSNVNFTDSVDKTATTTDDDEAEASVSSTPQRGVDRSPQRSCTGVKGKKIPTSTTLMMFVVTVLFILNFLPYLVVKVKSVLEAEPSRLVVDDSGEDKTLHNVLIRSYYLNGMVNPFVYGGCSARFRLECRRLFRPRNRH